MTALAEPLPTARSANRWLALTVLALAQFLVVLDASIVNIALPKLGQGLGLDPSLLSWVITAYVLPFGGLLLLGGRLADRVGFWVDDPREVTRLLRTEERSGSQDSWRT